MLKGVRSHYVQVLNILKINHKKESQKSEYKTNQALFYISRFVQSKKTKTNTKKVPK